MPDSPTAPALPGGSDEPLDPAILRLLMEALPDRIYFKDLNSRFVRVNRAHARWLGLSSPEEAVGRSDFDFFSPIHAATSLEDEQRIIRTGEPVINAIQHIVKRDGAVAWGSTTKMPWRDSAGRMIGTFGVTRDTTAMKQAQENLAEERNLLRTIIDHLPSRVFVKDLQGRFIINNASHLRWLGAADQAAASGRTVRDFFSRERAEQAEADDRIVLGGQSSIINEERSDLSPEGQARWALTTKVPFLDAENRIIGLVGISHDITERKRVEQELQRRSSEMEADLKMARQIQEAFFPRVFPTFPAGAPAGASALRFAHRYIPAATLGGDFFDVVAISDTLCGVLLCDVMGHGVRAGLLTALIRGVIEECSVGLRDPAQVLREVNRSLMPIVRQTGQPVFATAFFGVIDLAGDALAYANAGHPPPFLLRRDRGVAERLELADPEPAAGLVEDFPYSRRECPFARGDAFLGYTDGLFEASNAEGKMLGEEALRSMIEAGLRLPGPELIGRLLGAVESFTGRSSFEDDICVITVER